MRLDFHRHVCRRPSSCCSSGLLAGCNKLHIVSAEWRLVQIHSRAVSSQTGDILTGSGSKEPGVVVNHFLAETTLARIAGGSTLVAFALSASNMDIRPQTFSVPLFALFVFCILNGRLQARFGRKAIIALLTACMILWANLHGAFFTGLILLGALFAGQALQYFGARKRTLCAQLWGEIPRIQFLEAALLLGLSVVATLLNPRRGGDVQLCFQTGCFASRTKIYSRMAIAQFFGLVWRAVFRLPGRLSVDAGSTLLSLARHQ